MSAAYPNLSHAQYAGALGVVGRRRDATWGKFRFAPPELINPQIFFEPPPFRTQVPAPVRSKRARH